MARPRPDPGGPQISRSITATKKAFSVDDIVVTLAVFFGFGGAVGLWVVYSSPSAIVALLLAAGVSALVFRFLGGLEGSTFSALGAIKLTGTMGTLMAVFFLLNYYLELQQHPLGKSLAGEWRWQYAEGGRAAKFTFEDTSQHDKYTVHGTVSQHRPDTALFDIVAGTAVLNDKGRLDFKLTVKDYVRNRDAMWVTSKGAGLVPKTCYLGSFDVMDAKGTTRLDTASWGIGLEPFRR